MVRVKIALCFLVILCAGFCAHAQLLAKFDLNNYVGWTYTRAGIDVNNETIQTYKINVYGDYMLLSPMFDASKAKYVKVCVKICSKNYFLEKYNFTKASPTLALLDESGAVVAKKHHQYASAELYQEVEEYVVVPAGASMLQLRLSVPNGDVDSTGAVMTVACESSATDGMLAGDVNGDGEVNTGDVSALINIILGTGVTNAQADANGDGEVNTSDVSTIINFILG